MYLPRKNKNQQKKKISELLEGQGKRKTGSVLGIDAHKSVLACCIVNEEEVLFEKNYENSKTGITNLLKRCEKLSVKHAAVEATGTYHWKVVFSFIKKKIPILLANPQQTVNTQGKKTDKLDAKRIAIAHRDGRLLPSVISPKLIQQLRTSTRGLLKTIQSTTKCKQRLNQFFHRYDSKILSKFPNFLKSSWSTELLLKFVIDKNKKISELVNEYYPNRKSKSDRSKDKQFLTKELKRLDDELSPIDRANLKIELLQLRLNENIAEQQRLIYLQLAKDDIIFQRNMKILMSIQGIGKDTAAILLAEIVDIDYFPSASKLVKWAGLAPRVNQSGHRKRITGKIHKGGNKYIRRALTLACSNIYARGDKSHPIYLFIKRKKDQKDTYWLAICAGARKLLMIIWSLLKRIDYWRPSLFSTDEVKKHLQEQIKKKLLLLNSQIDKFEKAQAKLDLLMQENVETLFQHQTNYNKLIRLLTESIT